MPLLTIIVPVFRGEKYLKQCLDSIMNQIFTDFELIIVDDGSDDSSPMICDDYALLDNRISVIHKQNGGHNSARNEALKIAKGEYIAFVDCDDWIDSMMYQKMISQATRNNADVVIAGYILEDGKTQTEIRDPVETGVYVGQKLENLKKNALYSGKFYLPGIGPALWNKIYKKDIILKAQKNVNERIRVGEDAACIYPLISNATKVVILDECLYHYRRVLGSISHRPNINVWKENKLLIDSLRSALSVDKAEYYREGILYYETYMWYSRTLSYVRARIKQGGTIRSIVNEIEKEYVDLESDYSKLDLPISVNFTLYCLGKRYFELLIICIYLVVLFY